MLNIFRLILKAMAEWKNIKLRQLLNPLNLFRKFLIFCIISELLPESPKLKRKPPNGDRKKLTINCQSPVKITYENLRKILILYLKEKNSCFLKLLPKKEIPILTLCQKLKKFSMRFMSCFLHNFTAFRKYQNGKGASEIHLLNIYKKSLIKLKRG